MQAQKTKRVRLVQIKKNRQPHIIKQSCSRTRKNLTLPLFVLKLARTSRLPTSLSYCLFRQAPKVCSLGVTNSSSSSRWSLISILSASIRSLCMSKLGLGVDPSAWDLPNMLPLTFFFSNVPLKQILELCSYAHHHQWLQMQASYFAQLYIPTGFL